MQFFEIQAICWWCQENGLTVKEPNKVELPVFKKTQSILVEEKGRPAYVETAADQCLKLFDGYSEVLVWIVEWEIFPSGEDWPDYYRYREQYGEKRSLNKAPGHLFDANESDSLATLMIKVMNNGWDAHILCLRSGRVDQVGAFITHDGFLDLYS